MYIVLQKKKNMQNNAQIGDIDHYSVEFFNYSFLVFNSSCKIVTFHAWSDATLNIW